MKNDRPIFGHNNSLFMAITNLIGVAGIGVLFIFAVSIRSDIDVLKYQVADIKTKLIQSNIVSRETPQSVTLNTKEPFHGKNI